MTTWFSSITGCDCLSLSLRILDHERTCPARVRAIGGIGQNMEPADVTRLLKTAQFEEDDLEGFRRDQDVEHKEKWEFDENVTEVFDDMLERSIPQYSVMRDTVTEIAQHFAKRSTSIVDLGCSRGEALSRVARALGPAYNYVGVEVSDPMRRAAEARFQVEEYAAIVHGTDLREEFPPLHPEASVIMSVLTLQFIPIEYRQRVLFDCYNNLVDGGALILVEKVLGNTAELDAMMVERYYALKQENGYSGEEIERKRLSLEGVLVPVTAKMNEMFLESAGFRRIDSFWRWQNFAGWIAVK